MNNIFLIALVTLGTIHISHTSQVSTRIRKVGDSWVEKLIKSQHKLKHIEYVKKYFNGHEEKVMGVAGVREHYDSLCYSDPYYGSDGCDIHIDKEKFFKELEQDYSKQEAAAAHQNCESKL